MSDNTYDTNCACYEYNNGCSCITDKVSPCAGVQVDGCQCFRTNSDSVDGKNAEDESDEDTYYDDVYGKCVCHTKLHCHRCHSLHAEYEGYMC